MFKERIFIMKLKEVIEFLTIENIGFSKVSLVAMLENVGFENITDDTEINQRVLRNLNRYYNTEIKKMPRIRIDPRRDKYNLAFKCTYCNGGCSNSCHGFKGVCSDEVIKYNIENGFNRCSNGHQSPCYKRYINEISREELEECYNHNDGQPLCYESRLLIDWKSGAGRDQQTQEPRRITNSLQNSLAVLTTQVPNENDRIIFGVYIGDYIYEGDDEEPGYIKSRNEKYRILLTPEEAKKMNFWKYYKNQNAQDPDTNVSWGTGLFRYLKDTTCARILKDIVSLKEETSPEEALKAQKILEFYCDVKNIDINNIPNAEGPLS